MAKYEVNEAFLKPLRPGQEFDVDILTLLNDYEKSFDGNIDFTQAAMVVQGSSHIIAKVGLQNCSFDCILYFSV